ncbi:hypothetical protein EIP91_003047 [Steccherinum ochraceum]|uniref:Hydrophobin n=1 Tax=Steccherinum ochraceum TaxID=92696 RepID=A0A4R0RRR5_9APHY|nr:hypothetical protein EIP91_003047 [Steccherinum ochraceum]
MLAKIILTTLTLVAGASAYVPVIGPGDCSELLCCQAIITPQTTVSPLSDIAILPPIGLIGAACKTMPVPTKVNSLIQCNGIPACCPKILLETAPTPTQIGGLQVTPGCNIVDMFKTS